MALTPPAASVLKARYPEFTVVSDVLAGLVLTDAASMVDETWREGDRTPAMLAYAAHMLAMEGEPARSATIAAGGSASGGGSTGAVKRIKVGDVETEFAGAAGSGSSDAVGSAAWLSASAYGQQFLILRRRNFPAVAVA